ncbi:MAG: hypothetical protein HC892_19485 [Saprospiraceae bacterium]|nr:hypothetical protein [Saprospiraceae bacterium]
MSAISSILVLSVVWMMFYQNAPKKLVLEPAEVPLEKVEQVAPLVTTEDLQKTTKTKSPQKQVINLSALPPSEISKISSVDSFIDTKLEKMPDYQTKALPFERIAKLSPKKSPFVVFEATQDTIEQSKPVKTNLSGVVYFTYKSPFEVDFRKIRNLKNKLHRELRKDRIKPIVDYCHQIIYQPTSIVVNGLSLNEALSDKYRYILLDFGIPPGAHRQIQLLDEHILVGDFNSKSQLVRGAVQGKGKLILPLQPNPFLSN